MSPCFRAPYSNSSLSDVCRGSTFGQRHTSCYVHAKNKKEKWDLLIPYRFWRGLYNRFDRGVHPRQSVEDFLSAIQEETQQLQEQLASHKQVRQMSFVISQEKHNLLQHFVLIIEDDCCLMWWIENCWAGTGAGVQERCPESSHLWQEPHSVGPLSWARPGQHASGLHWGLPHQQPLSGQNARQQPDPAAEGPAPVIWNLPLQRQRSGVGNRRPELPFALQRGQRQGSRLWRGCLLNYLSKCSIW